MKPEEKDCYWQYQLEGVLYCKLRDVDCVYHGERVLVRIDLPSIGIFEGFVNYCNKEDFGLEMKLNDR